MERLYKKRPLAIESAPVNPESFDGNFFHPLPTSSLHGADNSPESFSSGGALYTIQLHDMVECEDSIDTSTNDSEISLISFYFDGINDVDYDADNESSVEDINPCNEIKEIPKFKKRELIYDDKEADDYNDSKESECRYEDKKIKNRGSANEQGNSEEFNVVYSEENDYLDKFYKEFVPHDEDIPSLFSVTSSTSSEDC